MTLVFSRRLLASTMAVAVLLLKVFLDAAGQSAAKGVEWRSYGADLANTHYSPLDQINGSNFSKLEATWRFKTASVGSRPETNLQSTPLMVGGVVYSTAGTERAVVALDAVSGQLLWSHTENEGARAANSPRQLSGRGLAYWSNGPGNSDERILYVTPGYRLIALNAKTGVPVPSFGRNGVVDLKLDDDQEIDLETGEIGLHATSCGRRHGDRRNHRQDKKGLSRFGCRRRSRDLMWEGGEAGSESTIKYLLLPRISRCRGLRWSLQGLANEQYAVCPTVLGIVGT